MGINGLKPLLEKVSSKVHLKDLRGSTVAFDTYIWLHKGALQCAEKLYRGEDSDKYVKYCLKYVYMFLSYGIKPILVFDGDHLPAKALTSKRRQEMREKCKKRAAELLRLGRIKEARSFMRRSLEVTHQMAFRLICECRSRNVDCIVAPYEADAQMAWLNKAGIAQYVVTEDSDLPLFGARNVIYKLDLSGAGLLVESNKLYLAMGCRSDEEYTFDKFLRSCILSGCDYLDSLPKIGLSRARKFILKTEEDDMWKALKNLLKSEVDDEYIENFHIAEATFKHMIIYNPLRRKMERLYELKEFETDLRYCCKAGTIMEEDEKAFQLALGNIDPCSLKRLDNWHPDNITIQANSIRAQHKSIWQQNFDAHKIEKMNDQELEYCINVRIQKGNKKPEEADISPMYRNELKENKPKQRKRKSRHSRSSCLSNDLERSAVVTRIRPNAFAKVVTSKEDKFGASAVKVLSPKNKLESYDKTATKLNALKQAATIKESFSGCLGKLESLTISHIKDNSKPNVKWNTLVFSQSRGPHLNSFEAKK